jgi:hypothetical protein
MKIGEQAGRGGAHRPSVTHDRDFELPAAML